ncbi:MAG: ABC-F family ATP-binding cassette domain-containing protein, partial [Burkholderiaceae bacterium]
KIMLSIVDITVMRGPKVLLEKAALNANLGDRIGLVGNNGTGKSSLFAVLRGELSAEAGSAEFPRSWRIAHVAQETPGLPDGAADFVMAGDAHLTALLRESETCTDDARLAELSHELEDANAYTARSRAESLLAGLGFAQTDMNRAVAEFSGGWRMRLNLARALMAPSELLLLDEPTNHLDLDAILWLEKWLIQYRGLMLIISHDREFLDGVCKSIVHIDQCKLTRYTGNYSAFELMRAERLGQQRAAATRQAEHVAKLERFITRFKAKASKARQAQSRVKMLEKLERIAPVLASNPVAFEFDPPEQTPDPLLALEHVACGYAADGDEKRILDNVTLTVRSGSRIGLLGINGAGKSTLVKTLAATQPELAGDLKRAKWLKVGYFAQHQLDMLDMEATPLIHMMRLDPTQREQVFRNFLGRFHFYGDMASSRVGHFSGGEKARLALAMIVWTKPNLLLLDEPTNHLDLETREALTAALAEYEGTLMLVSHDRHLLRATADELWLVADGGVREFDGDLDDYRSWLNDARKGEAKKAAKQAPQPQEVMKAASSPPPEPERSNRNDRDDRKEKTAERIRLAELRKPLQQRAARVEKKLADAQAELAKLNTALADPQLYESGDGTKIAQITQDQAYAARAVDELETEWLELQAQMEAMI